MKVNKTIGYIFMKNIVIVEDEAEAASILESFVTRYGDEHGEMFKTVRYCDAAAFLSAYKNADIVFMDIDLPGMNGMDACKLLREKDGGVIIIFVTNMSQMAIKGYEVRAFDFVVKPITYKGFAVKFKSALDALCKKRGKDIWISNKDGKMKLNTSEIEYVEIMSHILTYHTDSGSYRATGTLASLSNELKDEPFALCNRCYFVNLAYVTAIKGQNAIVAGNELAISRAKRTEFLSALNNYIAMNGD